MYQKIKCDVCLRSKNPMIYLRSSRKLCYLCWQDERSVIKAQIRALPKVVDRKAPLGYNFVMGHWFTNERQGKVFADHAFDNMKTAVS
jgi:hypothetical protein